jgi:hypothetical protein
VVRRQIVGKWRDLVMKKVKELEKRRKTDEAMLERLKSYLSDPVANKKGTSFEFNENKGTVSQLNELVFATWVSDGKIFLTPAGDKNAEPFKDEREAYDRMAALVAMAIMKARDEEDNKRREYARHSGT